VNRRQQVPKTKKLRVGKIGKEKTGAPSLQPGGDKPQKDKKGIKRPNVLDRTSSKPQSFSVVGGGHETQLGGKNRERGGFKRFSEKK